MSKSLLTFRQFGEKHPAFSQGSLRNLRFHRQTNGFKDAFVSVGRRVLIDEEKFFECIARQNGKRGE